MPVLVVTPEGAEEDTVVVGALAVAQWADGQPGSQAAPVALFPPPSSPHAQPLAALLQLHDALDEDDLTFCTANGLSRNLVRTTTHNCAPVLVACPASPQLSARQLLPQRLRSNTARLLALASDSATPSSVADAAAKAAAVAQARAARWADLDAPLRTTVAAACTALLDALESSLSAVGSGPFAGGLEAYSFGDAVLTVFLSLMSTSALVPGALDVSARRQSSLYLGAMKARPSYGAADVWSGPRPGKVLSILGGALAGPLSAVGTAVKAAAAPLQESEAFQGLRAAYADMHNSVTVPLQEEVKPAAESYIITPAYEASVAAISSVNTNVLQPVGQAAADGLGAAAGAVQRVAADVAETGPVKAVAQVVVDPVVQAGQSASAAPAGWLAATAEATAEAMGRVQDKYLTPLATTVADTLLIRVA